MRWRWALPGAASLKPGAVTTARTFERTRQQIMRNMAAMAAGGQATSTSMILHTKSRFIFCKQTACDGKFIGGGTALARAAEPTATKITASLMSPPSAAAAS
jgi:hypothetical protein